VFREKRKSKFSLRLRRLAAAFPNAVLAVWVLFLMSAALPAQAQGQSQESPRVAGMFGVKDVTDLGTEVRFTVQVHLFNSGDADVSNGKATLRTLLPLPLLSTTKTAQEIPPVSLRAHGEAEFEQEFTVPRAQFETLEKERRLVLTLQFQNGDGSPASHTIALRRMPMPKREQ